MVVRLLWCCAILFLLTSSITTLSGQIVPRAPGSVQITPDGANEPTRQANTGPYVALFTATSTYTVQVTVQLTCAGRNNVTCVSVVPSQVTLPAGGSFGEIEATYNVGAPHNKGQIVVRATQLGQDTGYYNLVIANAAAPVVALRNHNSDNQDRSLCLTSSAGEGVAWQCGDLLVAHGLPGYRTMGRDRTLTLIYNSAQAVPKPIVAVGVTQASLAPSQVFVRLSMNGTARDSAIYGGWSDSTRQIVIAHDAATDSTGLYPFSLLVRSIFADSGRTTTISDTLIVVNRKTTLYGAGWSLAGIEELRLNQPGGKILWLGGDGSAKVFRPVVSDSLFVGALGAFRDTLFRFDSASVRWWRRRLRHGVMVTYRDSLGAGRAKHVRTTNRVGNSTFFRWSGDTLKKILIPPDTTAFYTLTYASGRLDKITDPAGRILDATVASDRLTQIIDPDTTIYSTSFAYDAVGRLIGRTNRRNFTNRYGYANGLRMTIDSVRLDTAAVTYAVTTFTPWDERGLATSYSANTAVDVGAVYSKIDGPLPSVAGDTAEFWIDRWGAPTKVRDPLGYETVITRGDVLNPALVTRVQTPDGRIVAATYDSPRARLVRMIDSTFEGTGTTQVDTVVHYAYGSSIPDSPTEVRTPFDTTRFAYDPTLGLTDSVIAPGGIRTKFTYFLTGTQRGLLQSVIDRNVRVVDTTNWTRSLMHLTTSFTYDHWGNDSTVTTPKGNVTRYEYDAVRRPIKAYDALNHLREFTYNKFNEPTSAADYDPGAFTTQFVYTRTGEIDQVLDPRQVKRSWKYDAAGRAVAMTDDLTATETRFYGASGLLDSLRTRTSEIIRHRYDRAGRNTATIYAGHSNTFAAPLNVYNFTVPGDSVSRTYDAVGRLLVANNARSTVTFTYNKEGTVRSERQVFRNASGQIASDLTMRYWYDKASRRTKFFNGTDTVFYSYGVDSRLSKLKVQWIGANQAADSFFYFWDALGRRDSLFYSNQVSVTWGYDRDGNVRMVCSRHPVSTPGIDDYLEQRVRLTVNQDDLPMSRVQRAGDVPTNATCNDNPQDLIESASYSYDARHQMLQNQEGLFAYDSSGNRVSRRSGGTLDDTLVYVAQSNRLLRRKETGPNWVDYIHDLNGSRASERPPTVPTAGTRLYYYNALGQMTGMAANDGQQWFGGFQWCRYDALGRRVYSCDDGVQGLASFDGDNVIGTNSWRYLHGPGVDDPLVGIFNSGQGWVKYFYLTDGAGRLLAFTDTLARNVIGEPVYIVTGGNQAGAVDRAMSYSNARAESPQASGLSFYRNRYYDQNTGRWTQEDPIGVGGGINLYSYVGNNPATFMDPFGLCGSADDDGDTTRVQTRYEHLSKNCVQTGDTVQAGDIIGYSGSTGTATGPGLHFEVRMIGADTGDARSNSASTPIDPLNCFAAGFCGSVGTPGQVTSWFGSRPAPMPGASTDHQGIDFAAPLGTPIRAAARGVVVLSQSIRGGGNAVYINHYYVR